MLEEILLKINKGLSTMNPFYKDLILKKLLIQLNQKKKEYTNC